MKNDISLVLVTFNRSHLLLEMLCSVVNQTVLPNSVYVIDNNSSDDTAILVEEFAKKNIGTVEVFYHNTGANLGGAGGFEYGSRLAYEAGHEWIWLADDDVELEADCLENLIKYKDGAAILQPMRVNMDGSCAEVSGTDYQINSLTRLNPKRRTVEDIQTKDWEVVELKTIPFEGPMIHRSVFEKVGFPDPRFFIFYDDLDFALRAQKAGFKILCIRNAVIKRKIPFIQSRALSGWKGYFMYRNFFYVQLAYGKKSIACARVILIFLLVLTYTIIKGNLKSLPMLLDAFRDAFKGDFSGNEKYKPS